MSDTGSLDSSKGMIRPRRLVIVNNIPTPYRIHLFELLNAELAARDCGFEAWFMAPTEEGRYWQFDPSLWGFRCQIFPGAHAHWGRVTMHFNPGMVIEMRRSAPTWMLLAGGWLMPSVVALLAGRPLVNRTTRMLLWSEANSSSSRFRVGPVAALRRFVYGLSDAFVVPGQIAEDTIRRTWRIQARQFIPLPNIVDERVFNGLVARARCRRAEIRSRLGLDSGDLVLVLPARLQESQKGVLNFLRATKRVRTARVQILLAGDGPDKLKVMEWVRDSHDTGVHVLGHCSEPDIVDLYAVSDVFVLPSFHDPNPLAVVEALWAGLPLLISRACGNWPETVAEGRNGWLIDPHDANSMAGILDQVIETPSAVLQEYGKESLMIAEERFSSSRVVADLANRLEALMP